MITNATKRSLVIFNYSRSVTQANEIRAAADELKRIYDQYSENVILTGNVWTGEASVNYRRKYNKILSDLYMWINRYYLVADVMEKNANIKKDAELRILDIAEKRTYGGST